MAKVSGEELAAILTQESSETAKKTVMAPSSGLTVVLIMVIGAKVKNKATVS